MKAGTAVPADVRRDMARMYVTERKSLREIGRLTYWSAEAVKMALVTEGVTMRPRGGRRLRPYTQDDLDAVTEPYLAGLSTNTIASQLGVCQSTVCNRLRAAGVPFRTPAEAAEAFPREKVTRFGKNGLRSVRQRKALREVETFQVGALDTIEIAQRIGEPRSATLDALRRLEEYGLVARQKIRRGRYEINLWSRTSLALVDVLDEHTAELYKQPVGDGGGTLPARPLALAIKNLARLEESGNLWDALPPDHQHGRLEVLCERIGVSSKSRRDWEGGKRMRVQFKTADVAITRAGLAWWEVWPEGTDGHAEAAHLFAGEPLLRSAA